MLDETVASPNVRGSVGSRRSVGKRKPRRSDGDPRRTALGQPSEIGSAALVFCTVTLSKIVITVNKLWKTKGDLRGSPRRSMQSEPDCAAFRGGALVAERSVGDSAQVEC